jgi:transposase
MSAKFVTVDRQTPLLLPCDLRDWVRPSDMVHFIIEAVEGLPLHEFRVNHRGTGSEQYPPHTMLALLVYSYCNGVFSSRRIEDATYHHVGVRYLTGDTHPDHDTIAKFRRENLAAVHACFVNVLEQAREIGVLKVGTVSVDGTKMRASASKHKNVMYGRAGELIEQLDQEVKALLAEAEKADNADVDEGQQIPEQIAQRETLKAKLKDARERLEQRAKARAQAEEAEYLRKVAARKQREGSRKGKEIQPPTEQPESTEQINLVDEESRLMRKSKRHGYEQSYNAQAVVDADGSQLVLHARVVQAATDNRELVADVRGIPEQVGKPTAVLADSGYASEEQVAELERNRSVQVYVSVGAEAIQQRRLHDFRPAHRRSEQPIEPKCEWRRKMRDKLQTDEGRAIYARRKQTVEPVFGIIKQVMGFRQFLLRGLQKVHGEWELVTLAYNMKRFRNLKMAFA